MRKEDEFLYYRLKYLTYASRLNSINLSAAILLDTKVSVSEPVIERAKSSVYDDSRYEEDEMRSLIDDAMAHQPVSLFSSLTLGVLSGSDEPADVNARNLASFIERIEKSSSGYDDVDFEPASAYSFVGFRDHEVQWMLDRCRKEAEDALENLRDINTCMKYINRIRMKLNPALDHEDYPVDIMDKDRPYRGPLVANYWWMEAATKDSNLATRVRENLLSIGIDSCPDEGQPDSLDFFGSHCSNRLSLDYSVDILDAVL